jgi:hypothetical protein
MALPLLLVAGGAAGAAVVVAKSTSPTPTQVTSTGGVKGTGASAPGSAITDQLTSIGVVSIGSSSVSTLKSRYSALTQVVATPLSTSDRAPNTSPVDAALQQKFDTIDQYGNAAYDKLSADAKKAGAAALSKALDLNPPLSGDEDWKTIAKIAGGAAGVAAFGWAPGGAVWGPIVGSYLGVKLEELLSKDVDGIKNWFKGRWADIESSIEGAVHDAVNSVESWVGSIF